MGIIKTVILADAIKKAGQQQSAHNAPPPTQHNPPPQQPSGNYYQASVSGSRDVNTTSYGHQPWCNGCCGGQRSGGGAQYAGSAAQYYQQPPNQFAGTRSVAEHGLGSGNMNGQRGVDTPPSYEVGGAAASAELPSPVTGEERK